jgi:hypothetical protein
MRSIDLRFANVIAAASLTLALGTPALAQPVAYDEQSGQWSAEPPPPPPLEGNPAPPPMNADVSVDLATPGASVNFATFQEGLAPYGEWMTVGAYGRVWRPLRVAAGWRPYYYGRWEWTDEGWLWVSDEPWGWAAYHYGRWAYDPSYGWIWIPGYQWAPAWVTWRYSPEYIGWAPLGPGFSVYVTNYPVVYGWWTFVPCHRFVGVPVHSFAFTGRHVQGIYGATYPAPPRVAMAGARAPAWGGPARPFIEQRIGRPVAPVRVQPVASPKLIGTVQQAGLVQVYRPETRFPVTHGAAPAVPAGPGHAAVAAPTPPAPGAVAPARPAPAPASIAAPQRPMAGNPPSSPMPHPARPSTMATVPSPQVPMTAPLPHAPPSAPSAGSWARPAQRTDAVTPRGTPPTSGQAPGGVFRPAPVQAPPSQSPAPHQPAPAARPHPQGAFAPHSQPARPLGSAPAQAPFARQASPAVAIRSAEKAGGGQALGASPAHRR